MLDTQSYCLSRAVQHELLLTIASIRISDILIHIPATVSQSDTVAWNFGHTYCRQLWWFNNK